MTVGGCSIGSIGDSTVDVTGRWNGGLIDEFDGGTGCWSSRRIVKDGASGVNRSDDWLKLGGTQMSVGGGGFSSVTSRWNFRWTLSDGTSDASGARFDGWLKLGGTRMCGETHLCDDEESVD